MDFRVLKFVRPGGESCALRPVFFITQQTKHRTHMKIKKLWSNLVSSFKETSWGMRVHNAMLETRNEELEQAIEEIAKIVDVLRKKVK